MRHRGADDVYGHGFEQVSGEAPASSAVTSEKGADDFSDDLDLDFGEEEAPTKDEDYAYYNEMAESKKRKRDLKEATYKQNLAIYDGPAIDPDAEGKRKITYQILKNRGLTVKRKKEDRNPRVKRRLKFEKASIKLKSFRRVVDGDKNAANYEGEVTGIKTNLARSVKL